jgi:hypothetical protein
MCPPIIGPCAADVPVRDGLFEQTLTNAGQSLLGTSRKKPVSQRKDDSPTENKTERIG